MFCHKVKVELGCQGQFYDDQITTYGEKWAHKSCHLILKSNIK